MNPRWRQLVVTGLDEDEALAIRRHIPRRRTHSAARRPERELEQEAWCTNLEGRGRTDWHGIETSPEHEEHLTSIGRPTGEATAVGRRQPRGGWREKEP